MTRAEGATTKQDALLRLIAADPSLVNSVDTALLSSITLCTKPEDGGDMQPTTPDHAGKRTNVKLYAEDAVFATAALRDCPSASKTNQVEKDSSNQRKGLVTPIMLLDESVFKSVGSTDTRPQERCDESQKSIPKKRRWRLRQVESDEDKKRNDEEGNQASLDSVGKEQLVVLFDPSSSISSMSAAQEGSNNASDSDEGSQISSMSYSGDISMATFVLDHRCFVSRDQWVPRSARKACFVCLREFKVLRKRHSCRMCGEVICSRCSVFKQVDLPVLENKFRICSSCFVSYRRRLEDVENQQRAEEKDVIPCALSVAAVASDESMVREPEVVGSQNEHNSSSGSLLSAGSTVAMTSPTLSPSCSSSDFALFYSASSLSFSSDSTANSLSDGMPSRNIEDEYEAALRAKQLEREVEASQHRIRLLEAQIAEQENQKDRLTSEQQKQLAEARTTIQMLQEKLLRQEQSAKEAVRARDSICLSRLRQTEQLTSPDEESIALKKKLKILERQLQQAGISVAEVIPYELAKRKVSEISKRMQEIGSCEVTMDDKVAQAAARKEYYILEQEMEKYHTALLLTDEYIEEQCRKEREWEDTNRQPNLDAARLLWSAIPVNIARLSEKGLMEMNTPSGVKFPSELARRLKRTNVLQLLRENPKTIAKMHPSVIEGYRTTGLTLVERRALHHVMQAPFQEWKGQQKEEMAQRKFLWYSKLKEALVLAIDKLDSHVASTDKTSTDHSCDLLGGACPVRADGRSRALFGVGLGFPTVEMYLEAEIVKSDPDGAGEKARQEAQAYARELVANQRRRDLKAHYKTNVREVTLALGAMEAMDAMLDRVRSLDAVFPLTEASNGSANQQARQESKELNALLAGVRDLLQLLAKRAGISLSGKREAASDEPDARSSVETRAAAEAVEFVRWILDDVEAFLGDPTRGHCNVGLQRVMKSITTLLTDISRKNSEMLANNAPPSDARSCAGNTANVRVQWKDRPSKRQGATTTIDAESDESAPTMTTSQMKCVPRPPASAGLFDAIRTRRKNDCDRAETKGVNASSSAQSSSSRGLEGRPVDLLAAIRARKS